MSDLNEQLKEAQYQHALCYSALCWLALHSARMNHDPKCPVCGCATCLVNRALEQAKKEVVPGE